jgi:hypothetical protein
MAMAKGATAGGSSAADTESRLDAIHKEVKTAIKNNVKLTVPTTSGGQLAGTNDLSVMISIFGKSRFVDGGKWKGGVINGHMIQLTVKITS